MYAAFAMVLTEATRADVSATCWAPRMVAAWVRWARVLCDCEIWCVARSIVNPSMVRLPCVRTGMAVGVQPGPWIVSAGSGGAGPKQTARSFGAEMARSNMRAKADMRSALCWSPASEEDRETRSSAYPISETKAESEREVGMRKWIAGSVIANARRAISKNAVQA